MITQVLESSAVWGVLLTLAAFGLGVLINKRTGKAIFNPLLLGTAFVIVVLSVLNIPYDTYAASASPISYLLLPATVSLAVPLYEKWDLLCKNLVAIVAGVLAGEMTGGRVSDCKFHGMVQARDMQDETGLDYKKIVDGVVGRMPSGFGGSVTGEIINRVLITD